MNESRSRLFPASPLAQNQHRSVDLGQRGRSGTQSAHHRTHTDEKSVFADQFDIFACDIRIHGFTKIREVTLNHACELTIIYGPHEVVPSAQPDNIFAVAQILGMTYCNNRQSRMKPAQPTNNVDPIGIAMREIKQEQIRLYS